MSRWTRSSASSPIDPCDLARRGLALEELSSLINAHLDYEEAHAVPMIRRFFTERDFLQVEKSVMKATRREVPTLIGVVSDHVTSEEFAALVAAAPAVLALFWKVSWRRRWTAKRALLYGR